MPPLDDTGKIAAEADIEPADAPARPAPPPIPEPTPEPNLFSYLNTKGPAKSDNIFSYLNTGKPAAKDETPSALGAGVRGAVRGVAPAVTGLIGAGGGMEAGAAVGALGGPIGIAAGGLLGALAGGFGAGYLGGEAQEKALQYVPEWLKHKIGQSEEQRRADVEAHPYAAQIGEIAPNVLAFRPGPVLRGGAEAAGALGRVMQNPVTQRALPAGLMGGQEAIMQGIQDEPIDWTKVGIAAGAGAAMNRETELGRKLIGAGARPARSLLGSYAVDHPTPGGAPDTEPSGGAPPPGGLPPVGEAFGMDVGRGVEPVRVAAHTPEGDVVLEDAEGQKHPMAAADVARLRQDIPPPEPGTAPAAAVEPPAPPAAAVETPVPVPAAEPAPPAPPAAAPAAAPVTRVTPPTAAPPARAPDLFGDDGSVMANLDRIGAEIEAGPEAERAKLEAVVKGIPPEAVAPAAPPVEAQVPAALPVVRPEAELPPGGFQTAKGSVYQAHEDGTTTRNKSFHPEHGAADQGPQPRSEATFYVSPEDAQKLGEIQSIGGPARIIAPVGDGRWGVKYLEGKDAGKFEARTVVAPASDRPATGLTPVEVFKGGQRVHFGNEITRVGPEPPPAAAPAPPPLDPRFETKGWKLHLDPQTPEAAEEISAYLKAQGIPHKIGHSSGQEGKGMTVYIGHRDLVNGVAADLNERFGSVLRPANGDVLNDDRQIAGNVWGRFDARDPDFHQYGTNGIPGLNAHVGNAAVEGRWLSPEEIDHADRVLRHRYGEFYTGTEERAAAPALPVREEPPAPVVAPEAVEAAPAPGEARPPETPVPGSGAPGAAFIVGQPVFVKGRGHGAVTGVGPEGTTVTFPEFGQPTYTYPPGTEIWAAGEAEPVQVRQLSPEEMEERRRQKEAQRTAGDAGENPVPPTPAPAEAPPPAGENPEPYPIGSKIAKSLGVGDVVHQDTGEWFEITEVDKHHRFYVIKWDNGTNSALKSHEMAGMFEPQPYEDTKTGERRFSEPATVEKAGSIPADVARERRIAQLTAIKERIEELPSRDDIEEDALARTNAELAQLTEARSAGDNPVPPTERPIPEARPGREILAEDGSVLHEIKIGTGDVLRTASGRETAPAPRIEITSDRTANNTIRRMDAWLIDEAKKEAEATGNKHLLPILNNLDPKNFSQSDRDTVNYVVFGNETATERNLITGPAAGENPVPPTERPPTEAPPSNTDESRYNQARSQIEAIGTGGRITLGSLRSELKIKSETEWSALVSRLEQDGLITPKPNKQGQRTILRTEPRGQAGGQKETPVLPTATEGERQRLTPGEVISAGNGDQALREKFDEQVKRHQAFTADFAKRFEQNPNFEFTKDNHTYFASRDLNGDNPWRLTHFLDGEPTGHMEFRTPEEMAQEAWMLTGQGYEMRERAVPAVEKPVEAGDNPLDAARARHQSAYAEFTKARDAYRARQIGDEEFMAAKAAYDRAGAEYDAAIEAASNAPPAENVTRVTPAAGETARQPIAFRPIRDTTDPAFIPSTGASFPIQYAIVEARDLITSHHDDLSPNRDYPQALQPRSRERAETEAQLSGILNGDPRDPNATFRPELLGENPDAANGSPIIGPEGYVESGNARTMAIRRAYDRDLPQAQAYRAALEAQGYPTEGIEQPVLVRINRAEMDMPAREQLARDLNVAPQATMSASDRAMADAQQIPGDLLRLYSGGDIFSAANRAFWKGILDRIAKPSELPTMTNPEGGLSPAGQTRVKNALLAKAYGDKDFVTALTEDADSNIKAIGNALNDAAPHWARLRDAVADGRVSAEYDLTSPLIEAVRLIQHARDEGRNVVEYMNQRGLFGEGVSAETESLLRWMLGPPEWSRRHGREKIADTMVEYADSVLRPLRLGETRAAAPLLVENAREVAHGAAGDLFASPLGEPGSAAAVREGADQSRPEAPGREVDTAGADAPESGAAAAAKGRRPAGGLAEETRSEPAFFSALTRAVEAIPQPKAPGAQWANLIRNLTNKGVKQDEIAWSGVLDWLKDNPGLVTKNQLIEQLRANEVRIEEVQHGTSRDNVLPDEQSQREHGPAFEHLNAQIRDLDDQVRAAHYAGETDRAADLDMQVGILQRDREALHGRMVDETMARQNISGNRAKYPDYTLPGGENYRELLLTLPHEAAYPDRAELALKMFGKNYGELTGTQKAEVENAARTEDRSQNYRTSHWEEPNVLAHIRMDDRTDAEGRKVLHVAEIQSDWHQAGRRKGYQEEGKAEIDAAAAQAGELLKATREVRKKIEPQLDALYAEFREANEVSKASGRFTVINPDTMEELYRAPSGASQGDIARWMHENRQSGRPMTMSYEPDREAAARVMAVHDRISALEQERDRADQAHKQADEKHRQLLSTQSSRVPNAPLRTQWPELAMKRVLRYAAENGYDRVTWDNGETQAARYDLSKHIQSLTYEPPMKGGERTAYILSGRDPNGRHLDLGAHEPTELPNVVGKDVADRILKGDGATPGHVEQMREPAGWQAVGPRGEAWGIHPTREAAEQTLADHQTSRTLSGLDLKVGGEGMSGFYDKILPAFVNKYAKKWGAKVEAAEIDAGKNWFNYEGPEPINDQQWKRIGQEADRRSAALGRQWRDVYRAVEGREAMPFARAMNEHGSVELAEIAGGRMTDKTERAAVHAIDITQPMRDSVMVGQALWERQGKGAAAASARSLTEDLQTARSTGEYQPGLADSHRAARDFVRLMGRDSGNEHFGSVDTRTGEIRDAGTSDHPTEINFNQDTLGQLWNPPDGQTVDIHHNHGGGMPASGTDISMLAAPGVRWIVAHGIEGTVDGQAMFSAVSLRPEARAWLDRMSSDDAVRALKNLTQRAKEKIEPLIERLVKSGRIDPATADTIAQETINSALAGTGAVNYMSNFKLPDGVIPFAARIARDLGKDLPWRLSDGDTYNRVRQSAGAVRREEGMGRLSRSLESGPEAGQRSSAGPDQGSRVGAEPAAEPRGPPEIGGVAEEGTHRAVTPKEREQFTNPRSVAEAKFILPDGRLLGSGDETHEYISHNLGYGTGYDEVARMMRETGAARINAAEAIFGKGGDIHLETPPTPQQMARLDSYLKTRGGADVDLAYAGQFGRAERGADIRRLEQGALPRGGLAEEIGGPERTGDFTDQVQRETIREAGRYARNGGISEKFWRIFGAGPRSPGAGDHFFNLVNKDFTLPYTKSALDPRFNKAYSAVLKQYRDAAELLHDYRGSLDTWQGKDPAVWKKLFSAMEVLTLEGREVPTDGRAIIVQNLDKPHAALSKVGDTIRITDPDEIRMFGDYRRTMDKVWTDLVGETARQFGWEGAPSSTAIYRAAEEATGREQVRLKRAAQIVAAVEYAHRNSYLPLMRRGDYFLRVRPTAPNEAWNGEGYAPTAMFKLIDSLSPLERATGGIREGTPRLAQAAIEELRQQFPVGEYEIEHGPMFRSTDAIRDLDIPVIDKLMMLVGNDMRGTLRDRLESSGMDKEAARQSAQTDYDKLVDHVLDQIYEQRVAGFKRQRQGIPGYDSDFARSTGQYLNWLANHISSLRNREAMEAGEQAMAEHPDPRSQAYWRDFQRRREDYGDQLHGPIAKLRQAAFYYLLGANFATTAKILLHGPLRGVPVLTTGLGTQGRAQATADYVKASGQMLAAIRPGKSGLTLDYSKVPGLSEPERALLKSAERSGVAHEQTSDEMKAVQHGGEQALTERSRLWRRVLDIWGSNVSVGDRMVRGAMLVSAYRIANRAGMETINRVWDKNLNWKNAPQKTPEAFASFMVDQTVGIWGDINRMPILRSQLGAAMGQFKTYEVGYLSNLTNMMTRMGPEGKVSAALMLGGLGMMGGVAALPFAQDIEGAIEAVYKTVGGIAPNLEADLRDALDKLFPKGSGEMIVHGGRPLGIDWSGIGFGEVVSKNMRSPLDLFGAAASTFAGGPYRAYERENSGQGEAAAGRELLPNAARHMLDAIYPELSLTSASGGSKILKPEQLSDADRVKLGLGFQPETKAVAYQKRQETIHAQTAYRAALGAAENRIANLMDRGQPTTDAMAQYTKVLTDGINIGAFSPHEVDAARRQLHSKIAQRMHPELGSAAQRRMEGIKQAQP